MDIRVAVYYTGRHGPIEKVISSPPPSTHTDLLGKSVGGPNRPMSQQIIQRSRVEEQQRRQDAHRATAGSTSTATGDQSQQGGGGDEEGYWAYMQRQINERTEKLGIAGDSMGHLQEQSAGWAKDINQYVKQQKRKAVLGG